jgi:hypothetical protein
MIKKTCKENEKDKHTTSPISLKGMKKLGAKGPLLLNRLQLREDDSLFFFSF